MAFHRTAGKHKVVGSQQTEAEPSDRLLQFAFDNSLQANIIFTAWGGKIIKANKAASKLLGYSKEELLTKNRKDIFNISESRYRKMQKKRTAGGYVNAELTLIKKNGKKLPCQITSLAFAGDNGTEISLTTIVDISKMALKPEKIDTKKNGAETRLKESEIAYAVIEAHERERSDIGKELHDNINQLLSVSRLYLEMGRKEEINKEMYLSRSSEYIMNAIEGIRKLTRGMITSVIQDIGLCEAIDSTVRDTMEIYPVRIACKYDLTDTNLDDKFRMNVFRILQEQLNNILKHAKATVVNIGLSQNKKSVVLSMADNGVGFDTAQSFKGIGIKNIKNRAEAYGGTANFVSRPGKGCVLTVTFPYSAAIITKS
jgi:PAS domain S-box-containing protein